MTQVDSSLVQDLVCVKNQVLVRNGKLHPRDFFQNTISAAVLVSRAHRNLVCRETSCGQGLGGHSGLANEEGGVRA